MLARRAGERLDRPAADDPPRPRRSRPCSAATPGGSSGVPGRRTSGRTSASSVLLLRRRPRGSVTSARHRRRPAARWSVPGIVDACGVSERGRAEARRRTWSIWTSARQLSRATSTMPLAGQVGCQPSLASSARVAPAGVGQRAHRPRGRRVAFRSPTIEVGVGRLARPRGSTRVLAPPGSGRRSAPARRMHGQQQRSGRSPTVHLPGLEQRVAARSARPAAASREHHRRRRRRRPATPIAVRQQLRRARPASMPASSSER